MITQTDIQRIYNCKNNHNRRAIRRDYIAVVDYDEDLNLFISTKYYEHDGTELSPDDIDLKCNICGQFMVQSDVFAIQNEESKCDLKCMNAIGPKCVCSCGGPNHGVNWKI